jgi:tRNA modification GTPase
MEKRALILGNNKKELLESARYGTILRDGIKTAIIGRPNVGKSSLLNALLKQDRAIVTEVPGTTRDIIEDYINIKGLPVKIMDTAGIRKVEDIAEKEGVSRSIRAMQEASLVLLVLDGSEELHETDLELINKSDPEKTILVINKTDLPQKIQPHHPHTARISALKETGFEDLKDKIFEMALQGTKGYETVIVTNVRHVKALEGALVSLYSFINGLKSDTPLELLAIELRDALEKIGEIQGITTTEDILDRIFSNFCIGK